MSAKRILPAVTVFILAVCGGASLFLATRASAQGRQVLPTKLAAFKGAHAVGPMPATQRMNLALTLQLHNVQGLEALIGNLYNPSSPQYHQFLTAQQLSSATRASSGPSLRVVHKYAMYRSRGR